MTEQSGIVRLADGGSQAMDDVRRPEYTYEFTATVETNQRLTFVEMRVIADRIIASHAIIRSVTPKLVRSPMSNA
jgi:hypothetical protein